MGLLILIFIKLCFISWLHSSYVLNCEKKKKSDELLKSNLQPIEKKKKMYCASVLCLVQNYDNLPTVPFFDVGPALKSYCKCLACMIIPSQPTWNLHHHV